MMYFLRISFILILSFFAPRISLAQITIQQPNNPESRQLEHKPDERFVSPEIASSQYMTDAMLRAERLRLRKERNTFTLTGGLQATQTQFSNWAAGGDNTFNGLATLEVKHIYQRERFTYTTKFDARYGMSVIDTATFKNEDKFNINFQMAWSISRLWSISGMMDFRSQFARGYKFIEKKKTLVSDFMAPGVMDLSLGIMYKPKHWEITLSPITGSMLFVLSDSLSRRKTNGIEPGDHFKPMIGPSLSVNYDRKFANDLLRYRSKFYGFWNFRLDPNARWENWFTIQTTKWLGTSIYWNMIYDREAAVPKKDDNRFWQINYSIGLALTFTYRNKK